MADLKKELEDINKEIDELRKELRSEPLKPFKEEDIEAARLALGGLRAEIREMSSDLDYVSKSFKESVNELSRQNTFLTDARNSLKGIASISDKILQYRKGEISLSEKQLKNLQQQAKAKFDSLQNDIRSGELKGKNLQEAKDALNKQGLFNKELELTADIQRQVNKEIGLLGTGIGGVSKLLSKMGFGDMSQPLQDAIDKTKNARVQIELNKATQSELNELILLQDKNIEDLSEKELERLFELEEKYSIIKENNKQALDISKNTNKELESQTSKYKNIGKALKDQLTSANLLDYAFKELIEAFGTSQKGIGDLAKGLGMSASRATVMRQEFADIANHSMNANLTAKAMQDTQLAVGQALGTNAKLNIEDLKTMTDLVKKTGLQHK
jgi:chromosome segregation ATPase